jgi:hypothetical protein
MSAAKEVDVEMQLGLAAATAAWPATPDLRSRVLARIEAGTEDEGATRPTAGDAARRGRRTRLVPALVAALLALLVLAGVAAALGLRLPGLDIVFVSRLPPAGAGLDLGTPIPLADARAFDQPRLLLPGALPDPDVAYEIGAGARRIVTVAWRAEPGRPTIPGTDLSLALMAVPGATNEQLATKMIAGGTNVEPVTVGGRSGWWIAGAPHEIIIARPDGDYAPVRSAIVGDTLVFAQDGTVYRLESALGRDATIAIAETLR